MKQHSSISVAALVLACSLLGCSQHQDEAADLPPPVVTVSCPIEKDVTDYSYFTGRLGAVDTVMVRARVSGYLDKIRFKDGELVRKNDVLFEIDSRLYKAACDQAEANVAQLEARFNRMQGDHDRARATFNRGAMSREEYERYFGDREESRSAFDSARAALVTAKLNLGFTKVLAPASGRISRRLVDRGNLVRADDTILTSIVTETEADSSEKVIYASFDVDDLTYQRIRNRVRYDDYPTGRIFPLGSQETPTEPLTVELGLVDEKGYPHRGVIDFVDNQLDAGTGTMRMRGTFPNANRALTPGLFARVRVPQGDSHKALLITDRAIDTDQGQKVVYVVNDKDIVEKREVELAGLHDGMREIKSGVKAGERVVVDGIQRVRAGVHVVVKAPTE